MKLLRIATIAIALVCVFSVTTLAVQFTPSVEAKDSPTLVEGEDGLIVTPIAKLYDEDVNLHDDIADSLTDTKDVLSDNDWQSIVEDFEDFWEELTSGAPIEHAVVSEIFDVRFESELGDDNTPGKTVTFKITVQGIGPDDIFMIVSKSDTDDHMEVVDYTIDENGVITITATSKSAFAIIRDSCPKPECDHDSPQTGVAPYCTPAIIGIIFFGTLAVVCAVKLKRVSVK